MCYSGFRCLFSTKSTYQKLAKYQEKLTLFCKRIDQNKNGSIRYLKVMYFMIRTPLPLRNPKTPLEVHDILPIDSII